MLILLCLPITSAFADEWHFSGVERVVAISDVHGAYDDMVATLQQSDVLDEERSWSGGETHLVLTGDMLDRGADSRRVMDLMMRIEAEALKTGGRVHVLLGNHEIMNLIGDLRYVADGEYAAFIDEESEDERDVWFAYFMRHMEEGLDEPAARKQFDEAAPPGFFGHRNAFRRDGIYGKWLLEKPLMIVINDTAYVHGGLPPYVAEHGLAGVNGTLKTDVLDYMSTSSRLQKAGILSPVDGFRERAKTLQKRMQGRQLGDGVEATARKLLELGDSPVHGMEGPMWYRGSSTCSELVEGGALNEALQKIGASRVVIGHTTTFSRQVQQRLSGRVIEINTGMLKPSYGGSGYALVIENDVVSVVSQDGTPDLTPIKLPRQVGYESDAIDDDILSGILMNGTATDLNKGTEAWKLLSVAADDTTVLAYFKPLPTEKIFIPELAAYRLDRMLGLDMIPVTVLREIEGEPGTLQFVPVETLSESERISDDGGRKASCSLEKQQNAMHVFDALIHNTERAPLSMLYNPDDWQLILIVHENSFEAEEVPLLRVGKTAAGIDGQWQTALLELSDQVLRDNLGDVLDDARLKALARRRDALIEISAR